MKNLLLLVIGAFLSLTAQHVSAQCNAAFEWEQLPNSLSIHFINHSTSEHDITSYLWNFGDGHTGDGQNPTHTYPEPGVYLVCLTIHDNEGCVDDVCHEVTVESVSNNCEAFFEFEINQATQTVHFFDGSESSSDIASYHWNFGDGHTGDGQNPVHTYAENGTYEVCLTIVSETGCEDTYCHAVIIEGAPGNCEAFFEFEINQATYTVHFFDGSDSDHDIVSWIWDFGDDHSGDGPNPVHVYDEPGTYEVCLTIVSETGCEDTYCHAVHIEGVAEGCEAFFEFEINQATNTVHFFDGSTSEHDIVQWHWNFGDGHTGDGQNPVHEYAEPGSYEVCLVIVSETGCEDSYCHLVVIEGGGLECEAGFTFDINQETNTVHFFDNSYSEHDIVQWHWNFGDGHTGDGPNPVHEYAEPGSYEVCLVIVSETGCEDNICHLVVIEGAGLECEAGFEFEINQETNTVHFFDNSYSEHDIVQWHWNFGDGQTGDGPNPVHTYEQDGTYEVCLVIVSETGCEDSYCHHVVIGNGGIECEAGFMFEINQETNTVHFFDNSYSEHDIVQWHWNFGDGHTGDGPNPVHTYEQDGTYEVCLVIVSETGCEDNICHAVVIGGGGNGCEAYFTFDINQETYTVHFFDHSTSEHDIVQWHWNFGDGFTGDGPNPVHIYDQPGTYEVCLVIVSETGCEDSYCHHVVIHEPEPCHASFYWEYNHDTDSLVFHNTSTGSTAHTTWLWTFGDGETSTEENPQHEYAEEGVYTICLIMTDTTTDCSSDVCHTFVQEFQNEEENNEEFENEEPPASFTGDGPIFRYTNPVSDEIMLSAWISKTTVITVQLRDLTGNIVVSTNLGVHNTGLLTTSLSVPALQPGMYTIEMTTGNQRIIRPVMIIQ